MGVLLLIGGAGIVVEGYLAVRGLWSYPGATSSQWFGWSFVAGGLTTCMGAVLFFF